VARRVLVTGATGFVGAHLIPALLGAGYEVRAAVRGTDRAAAPKLESVEIGDLRQRIDWRPMLEDVDAVVHLAGIAHADAPISADEYERVNRVATRELAHAAAEARACVVFVSSVRAQAGPSAPDVLTESTPPAPTDAYGRSKLAAERDLAQTGGAFVVLRPTLVYGTGVRGNMAALVRLAHKPIPLPFGGIRNARSLLAVENLIGAIKLSLTSDAALGQTFLVADPTPVSLPDIIAHLRRGLGRGPGLFSVPNAFFRIPLKAAGRGDLWERLAGNLVVATSRLAAAGYAPSISTEEGLVALGRSVR
jgi:UDP-glucose 4-epimerase